MRRVVIDTDVASLSIKQRLPPPLLRQLVGAQVGITFVTLGELTRWATMRQWGSTRRDELEGWLASRPTLPYTDAVARKWGDTPRTQLAAGGHDRRTTRGSQPAAWCTTYRSRP